jgi:hypothetical protein
MALPASSVPTGAVADLGLGDLLGQQVAGETEEARKKRMQQMDLNRLVGPSGSMAANSLGLGGPNAGY